jgi:hypothetical protein
MFKPHDPATLGDTISRIWTFALFCMVFRDIHEMATESTIQGILEGRYEGNPVTDAGLVFGGFALILMLLSALLTPLLQPYAAKHLNLIMAPLAFGGMFYVFPNDPDDYLLGGATALAILAIFIISLFWRTNETSRSLGGLSNAT